MEGQTPARHEPSTDWRIGWYREILQVAGLNWTAQKHWSWQEQALNTRSINTRQDPRCRLCWVGFFIAFASLNLERTIMTLTCTSFQGHALQTIFRTVWLLWPQRVLFKKEIIICWLHCLWGQMSSWTTDLGKQYNTVVILVYIATVWKPHVCFELTQ